MTLPELSDCNEKQETIMPEATSSSSSIPTPDLPEDKLSQALKMVLQQGAAQGRVTCSLASSVELLSTRPDDVMLCVMPILPHADAAATIQSTLIRAVCQEHSIRILIVDCDIKLAKAVCHEAEESAKSVETMDANSNTVFKTPSACSDDAPLLIACCDNFAPVMGFPCVLVEYPRDGASTEDEVVAEFCKELMLGQHHQEPYLELPD